MAGPEDHLPSRFDDEQILALLTSISFPHPSSIHQLKVTAWFHIIYVLTYDSDVLVQKLPTTVVNPASPTVDLLLRIAGDHVLGLKTENESAVLVASPKFNHLAKLTIFQTWVRKNTSIPVPHVISYDVTILNPLKREFMLLNRCPGVPVSDIYYDLSQVQLDSLIHQLIAIQEELHTHKFHTIGGMMHSPVNANTIVSGPIIGKS